MDLAASQASKGHMERLGKADFSSTAHPLFAQQTYSSRPFFDPFWPRFTSFCAPSSTRHALLVHRYPLWVSERAFNPFCRHSAAFFEPIKSRSTSFCPQSRFCLAFSACPSSQASSDTLSRAASMLHRPNQEEKEVAKLALRFLLAFLLFFASPISYESDPFSPLFDEKLASNSTTPLFSQPLSSSSAWIVHSPCIFLRLWPFWQVILSANSRFAYFSTLFSYLLAFCDIICSKQPLIMPRH